MSVDVALITADDLLAMPADGHRYELVEGELQKMSPSGADHGSVAATIAYSLTHFVRNRALGKVYVADAGFLLARDPDTVRAPDVAFVAAARVVKTARFFPGAPDLAVEVLSPNDAYTEVEKKIREYLRYGTRAVVLVEPDTQVVRVHRADRSPEDMRDALTVDDILPGWRLPLSEIFED